jgi:hypothetical protein
LIEGELGEEADIGDSRVREVYCSGRPKHYCYAEYVADTPVLSHDEILDDQRPVWATLFSDPRLRRAMLEAWGETVSVGGQETVSAVMRLTCDRAAHRQINWSNIDADGMRRLCDYSELVNFD